jgi:hypothetical protein
VPLLICCSSSWTIGAAQLPSQLLVGQHIGPSDSLQHAHDVGLHYRPVSVAQRLYALLSIEFLVTNAAVTRTFYRE